MCSFEFLFRAGREAVYLQFPMPLFDEQISRKPDHYPWVQDYIDAMWEGHWTPNEFNFQGDVQDFKTTLTKPEQQIITNTLSAIGQIEIAVKKFWARLGDNLPHPSLSDLGYVMAGIEVIHNIAYEKLLTVLDLQGVFEENLKLDIIKGRVAYLRKYNEKVYTNDKKQYIYAMILFTLFVENVSLFSQFYIILWFNRYRNVLRDTANQVQYTMKEELIHGQVGARLINQMRAEYPELFDEDLLARVAHEAKEAFKAETKIVGWMLGDYQEDKLSKVVLDEFVKNRINDSLIQIGCEPVFEIDPVLIQDSAWMDEEIYAPAMTDFFEKRATEYSKGGAPRGADQLY